MTKRVIATVAAAALALTAFTAAPARAGYTDFEKFILGAGAIFIIGSAVNSAKQRRNPNVVTRPNQRPGNVIQVPAYCIHGQGQSRWVDWSCVRRAGY